MRASARLRNLMRRMGMAAFALLLSCSGGGGDKAQPLPSTAPTISSISPTSGAAGTAVTINGTGLDTVTAVTFNAVAASIGTRTATQLSTTVPGGATTGAIVVTGPGGTAVSSSTFIVVPSNAPPSAPVIVGSSSVITLHPATYSLNATDAEGDPITFVISGVTPVVPNIGPTSGSASFTWVAATAGAQTFSVIAQDSGTTRNSTPSTFVVNITANRPPQFVSQPTGQLIGSSSTIAWNTFQVSAQDPDNDDLVYGVGTAAFVDNTGAATTGNISINATTGAVDFTGTVPAGKTSVTATFTVTATDVLPGSGVVLGAQATQSVSLTYFTVSGAGTVQFNVRAGAGEQAISNLIYGMGLTNSNLDLHPPEPFAPPPSDLTLFRIGGDAWTPYNWTNNDTNAGLNYFYFNTGELLLASDAPGPGNAVKARVRDAFAQQASIIVTVPMLGYVAADGDGTDVRLTPDYIHVRFKPSVAKKGAAFGPGDPTAPVVYQDEFVNWLEEQFPTAHDQGKPNIFYSLDNEADLWWETHAATHPNHTTYEEHIQKSIAYADAIKAVAPKALVFGPVTSGWAGNVSLGGAPDASTNTGDFLDNYLARTKGHVDVLDVHWYPDVTVVTAGGTSIDLDMSKVAVSESIDPAVKAVRVQLPRSLWDPSYVENGWITQTQTGGQAIALIPRLKSKINAISPGLRLAFTEYYYGASTDISGAIAQADVFGIFGTQGVFAATVFPNVQNTQTFLYAACNMFRNYNGTHGAFGDTSLPATTSDGAKTSIYASTDAGPRNRVVIIALNKTPGDLTAGINVSFDTSMAFTRAEVYQLTAASPVPARQPDITITTSGGATSFISTLPAMSVTTMELRP